jgi:thymidylate synthase
MHLRAESLDDLLFRTFSKLIAHGERISPTKGAASEIVGAYLKLTRPRARLSRSDTKSTLFSCLGEFLWYLAASDKLSFIKYYIPEYTKFSDDGLTIFGAYGPRLFVKHGRGQVENVTAILKRNPSSRKAVIQLFDSKDLLRAHKDVPCTCTLQFFLRRVRKPKLHLAVSMRSNDAYKGLPHDVFAFTMLQEIVARTLGADVGTYHHFVGSLHLYDTDVEAAKAFIAEGWQRSVEMPPMPGGDPWVAIAELKKAESRIRNGTPVDPKCWSLPSYWQDIIRLLQVFAASKNGDQAQVRRVRARIGSDVFRPYVDRRERIASRSATTTPVQSEMPFE